MRTQYLSPTSLNKARSSKACYGRGMRQRRQWRRVVKLSGGVGRALRERKKNKIKGKTIEEDKAKWRPDLIVQELKQGRRKQLKPKRTKGNVIRGYEFI